MISANSRPPEYVETEDTLADYRRRYGAPNTIYNYYPVVEYGWWDGTDYVSMRVEGKHHEAYRWVNRPVPTIDDW